MFREIKSGVQFLTDFLSRNNIVPRYKIEQFSVTLEKLLCNKYDNHWFPNKPFQGSAFRCIRITQKIMDPEVEKAAIMSGVSFSELTNTLPKEFTMWIDPNDVSYRIGEEGSICTLDEVSIENNDSSVIQRCQSEVFMSDIIESPNNTTYTQCWS